MTVVTTTTTTNEDQQDDDLLSCLPLVMPTPDDFHSLSRLQTLAFAKENGEYTEKQLKESQRNNYLAYVRFQKECPVHLSHCRIIKNHENNEEVLAAIQLQVRRRRRPDISHNNNNKDSKEIGDNTILQVFIEWIGCHPNYEGRGLGSKLLQWAMTYTKKTLQVNVLSLYVVQANQRAVQLYKYKGFVLASDKNRRRKNSNNNRKGEETTTMKKDKKKKTKGGGRSSSSSSICSKSLEKFFTSLLCFGFNKYWTVLEMEKCLLHVH